jgi:hypothetical protein
MIKGGTNHGLFVCVCVRVCVCCLSNLRLFFSLFFAFLLILCVFGCLFVDVWLQKINWSQWKYGTIIYLCKCNQTLLQNHIIYAPNIVTTIINATKFCLFEIFYLIKLTKIFSQIIHCQLHMD